MSRVGVVLHGADDDASQHAELLVDLLAGLGHEVVGVKGETADSPHIETVTANDFGARLDLAVSLGGDGTMLRTVGLLGGASVKILGVNFGDLGYLTVIEPDDLELAVGRALSGDHSIENRMLVMGDLDGYAVHALNDIVVERSPGETTVRIGVSIDGDRFTSYAADGLIVATPTGSTAYALSARGPVVAPTHESLQLTPVSPHMLFDRTVVLEPETTIDLTVEGHRSAVVSVDGHTVASMAPGQTIRCSRSPRIARLVTFDKRDHLAVLRAKLGLAHR